MKPEDYASARQSYSYMPARFGALLLKPDVPADWVPGYDMAALLDRQRSAFLKEGPPSRRGAPDSRPAHAELIRE
ncbi:hypothetical protein [Reyranella sp.]|uniref:hypothetical protein n=1 Tax=Reyranella sp. TaxID=1929291 RepID=UPI0025DFEE51|nr:hypothetical protein [Reyranella sp.]